MYPNVILKVKFLANSAVSTGRNILPFACVIGQTCLLLSSRFCSRLPISHVACHIASDCFHPLRMELTSAAACDRSFPLAAAAIPEQRAPGSVVSALLSLYGCGEELLLCLCCCLTCGGRGIGKESLLINRLKVCNRGNSSYTLPVWAKVEESVWDRKGNFSR